MKEEKRVSPEATRNLEEGMLAYQQREYRRAVEYLSLGLSLGGDNWECRLYLAMAYFHIDEVDLSRAEFRKIMNGCLDRDLRLKAAAALAATNRQAP